MNLNIIFYAFAIVGGFFAGILIVAVIKGVANLKNHASQKEMMDFLCGAGYMMIRNIPGIQELTKRDPIAAATLLSEVHVVRLAQKAYDNPDKTPVELVNQYIEECQELQASIMER